MSAFVHDVLGLTWFGFWSAILAGVLWVTALRVGTWLLRRAATRKWRREATER